MENREKKQLEILFGHLGGLRYLLKDEFLEDKKANASLMGKKFTLEKFREILKEHLERTEKELDETWNDDEYAEVPF